MLKVLIAKSFKRQLSVYGCNFFEVFSSLTEISQRIFRVALLFICQGTSKAIVCVNPSSKARFHKMRFMQRIILRQQSSSNFVARCALQLFAFFVLTVFHTQLVYIIMCMFSCQQLFEIFLNYFFKSLHHIFSGGITQYHFPYGLSTTRCSD